MSFLSPYFWLILVGLFCGGWVAGCTHEHGEVVSLEESIKLDKETRLAAAKQEETERAQAMAKADKNAKDAEEKRDAALRDLKKANTARDNLLAARRADSDLIARMRDSLRAAEPPSPQAAGTPAKDPSPVTGYTSERSLAGWADQVIFLYKACRDQVIEIVAATDEQAEIH